MKTLSNGRCLHFPNQIEPAIRKCKEKEQYRLYDTEEWPRCQVEEYHSCKHELPLFNSCKKALAMNLEQQKVFGVASTWTCHKRCLVSPQGFHTHLKGRPEQCVSLVPQQAFDDLRVHLHDIYRESKQEVIFQFRNKDNQRKLPLLYSYEL